MMLLVIVVFMGVYTAEKSLEMLFNDWSLIAILLLKMGVLTIQRRC